MTRSCHGIPPGGCRGVMDWAPVRGRRVGARTGTRREGIATVMALMLVLVLLTLAVGMMEATNSTLQRSANLAAIQVADLQAESGLSLMIYHLNNLVIEDAEDSNAILNSIATCLGSRMNGTAALNQGDVVFSPGDSIGTIHVPIVTSGG